MAGQRVRKISGRSLPSSRANNTPKLSLWAPVANSLIETLLCLEENLRRKTQE